MLRSLRFDRACLGTLLLAASLMLIAPPAAAQAEARGQGWEWEEDEREDEEQDEQAVDDDPFDRPGFYAGISGVYTYNFFDQSIEDFLEDELGEQGSVDIDDSAGLNARIGYRAASWFAAEIQYEWVETYDVNVSGDVGPGGSTLSGKLYDIDGHTLTLNTKWIIPFWRIQPYLLLGAGGSFYDVGRGPLAAPLEAADEDIEIEGGKQSAFAGRAGLGIDFYVTQHIVISTEATAMVTTEDFEKPSEGAIDDLYYLSFGAGLQYRF
jgi:opacity protein-like surface antigen